jgi:hypothetical protein
MQAVHHHSAPPQQEVSSLSGLPLHLIYTQHTAPQPPFHHTAHITTTVLHRRAKADAVEAEVAGARAELAALQAVAADLDSLEERYW